MKVRHPLLILAILLAVSSTADETWTLRMDGIGQARIGMSLQQLSSALNEKFVEPRGQEEENCFHITPSKHDDVSFLFLGKDLARVDIVEPGIATTTGIRVGDPEQKVIKSYGSAVVVEPYRTTEMEGHTLTVYSKDRLYGIRFLTDGKAVQGMYAGRYDAVKYFRQCE